MTCSNVDIKNNLHFVNYETSWVFHTPVVYQIFKHLSAKQLKRCARVCSLWRDIAKNVETNREKTCDGIRGCIDAFQEYLTTLPNDPKFIFVISTASHLCWELLCFTSYVQLSFLSKERKLSKIVPLSSDIGVCFAEAIIGSSSVSHEILYQVCGMTAVIFPVFLDLEIYKFPLSGFSIGQSFDTEEDLYKFLTVPINKSIKLILVFLYDRIVDSPSWNLTETAFKMLDKTNNKVDFSVSGVLIKNISFPRSKIRRRNQSYGLAFTGNVETMTIHVSPEIQYCKILQALKQFESLVTKDRHCVVFVFKEMSLFMASKMSNSSAETIAFQEIFPNIPMIGAVGKVVITYDKLFENANNRSLNLTQDTIFILISIKK